MADRSVWPGPDHEGCSRADHGRGGSRQLGSPGAGRNVSVVDVAVVVRREPTHACAHARAYARSRARDAYTKTTTTNTTVTNRGIYRGASGSIGRKLPQNRRGPSPRAASWRPTVPLTSLRYASASFAGGRRDSGWPHGSGGGLTAKCEQMMLQTSRCRRSHIMLSRGGTQVIDIAEMGRLTGRNRADRALTFALCVQRRVSARRSRSVGLRASLAQRCLKKTSEMAPGRAQRAAAAATPPAPPPGASVALACPHTSTRAVLARFPDADPREAGDRVRVRVRR